ncbi:hypothetical protein M405DRAFT_824778 [Rhizopogon salebrosus TDB-379]|nr:hypothetical protein M405DRAFT_824778 [Rhizopogon salebrosus TDB-379]
MHMLPSSHLHPATLKHQHQVQRARIIGRGQRLPAILAYALSSLPILETLSVYCYGDISYRDLDLHNPFTSDVFRPLLTFGRLTVVKFLAMGKFHLDDGFMEAAAVA